jgi:hypothetical protein
MLVTGSVSAGEVQKSRQVSQELEQLLEDARAAEATAGKQYTDTALQASQLSEQLEQATVCLAAAQEGLR